ncbi:hypothetical protein P7C70_g3498, partial [Phenoliferia sp. Uapishka_3]
MISLLPPELWLQIIAATVPSYPESAAKTTFAVLRNFALVSSEWRAFANPLLYAAPTLTSAREVDMLLDSLEHNEKLRSYVKTLALHLESQMDATRLDELLKRCGGIDSLSVSRLGSTMFDFAWLESLPFVEKLVPHLDSAVVYIGDSGAIAGILRTGMAASRILFDVDWDDMHLLQTSPDAGTWQIENLRYNELDGFNDDGGFDATLEHDTTALQSLRAVYVPHSSNALRKVPYFERTERERMVKTCTRRGVRMVDGGECDWDLESLISTAFVKEKTLESNRT